MLVAEERVDERGAPGRPPAPDGPRAPRWPVGCRGSRWIRRLLRESARPDLFDLIGIGPMIRFAGRVITLLAVLVPFDRRPATV